MLPAKPDASVAGTCRRAAALPTRPAKDREEASTRRPVVAIADIARRKRRRWRGAAKNTAQHCVARHSAGQKNPLHSFSRPWIAFWSFSSAIQKGTTQETPLFCERARGCKTWKQGQLLHQLASISTAAVTGLPPADHSCRCQHCCPGPHWWASSAGDFLLQAVQLLPGGPGGNPATAPPPPPPPDPAPTGPGARWRPGSS